MSGRDHLIEFRSGPRAGWETWALRYGTAIEARESAARLLRDLRSEHRHPGVRVDGAQLRALPPLSGESSPAAAPGSTAGCPRDGARSVLGASPSSEARR